MIPWELLDQAPVAGSAEVLSLWRRGNEYSIRIGRQELMNSRAHHSEEMLAELTCAKVRDRPAPGVLIAGLGMGYTLAAALRQLPAESRVTVAELVPAVVHWNQHHLGTLAGHPLDDQRVRVVEGDVGKVLRQEPAAYDAILLDVDNGPEGLTSRANDALYSPAGLAAACTALRPQGVLAVWSAHPCAPFAKRLGQAGFAVEEVRLRARGRLGGGRHTVWLATRKG
jgi:spermidine synthase